MKRDREIEGMKERMSENIRLFIDRMPIVVKGYIVNSRFKLFTKPNKFYGQTTTFAVLKLFVSILI